MADLRRGPLGGPETPPGRRRSHESSQASTPRKQNRYTQPKQASNHASNQRSMIGGAVDIVTRTMDVSLDELPQAEGVPPHKNPGWDVGERPAVRMAQIELPEYSYSQTRRKTSRTVASMGPDLCAVVRTDRNLLVVRKYEDEDGRVRERIELGGAEVREVMQRREKARQGAGWASVKRSAYKPLGRLQELPERGEALRKVRCRTPACCAQPAGRTPSLTPALSALHGGAPCAAAPSPPASAASSTGGEQGLGGEAQGDDARRPGEGAAAQVRGTRPSTPPAALRPPPARPPSPQHPTPDPPLHPRLCAQGARQPARRPIDGRAASMAWHSIA